jgi:hypothetical protein
VISFLSFSLFLNVFTFGHGCEDGNEDENEDAIPIAVALN